MPKTKISEFSATPANNTDIDSINLAEGMAPSLVNDAIRELMSQLKDFQTGAVGDSFNGPVGSTTPAAGAFTTLSASSTLGVTGVATLGAGAILNTPASVTLTNATGLPIATGVSGLGTGVATFLATPSSANLRSALTDETGTGSAVFATSPTLVTPTLGVATATSLQGIIGNVTPAAGSFTTLSASSTLSVTGAGSIEGLTVGRGAGAVASNMAVGVSALGGGSQTGIQNTAVGYQAMLANTSGSYNTAFGFTAMRDNTTGEQNAAFGREALQLNTTGIYNTASGMSALRVNLSGSNNSAFGFQALTANTASNNVAVGYQALTANTTASNNTAVGYQAGYNITTGANSACFGNNSGSDAVRNITTNNNEIVMGNNSHTAAYIKIAWTVTSDSRDKTSFALVQHGLAFVNSLTPTAYQFRVSREDETPSGPVRYGFKAQDILSAEGANPVIIDNSDPDNLKYNQDSMIAVLVNAIKELKAEFDAYKASHP